MRWTSGVLCVLLLAVTSQAQTTDEASTPMMAVLTNKPTVAVATTQFVNPVQTTMATTQFVKPVQTTTTTPFVEPVQTTTTTPFVQPVQTTTTTPFVQPVQTTTTTPFVQPVETTTTTPFVEPVQTTTTTPFVEPVQTTTTTPFVQPVETTTTTTPFVNPVQTTQSADCNNKKADMVFLLDASTSEGKDNFKKQLSFVKSLVGLLDIGPNAVRVGLVTFSSDAHLQFHLNEHMDKTELMLALDFVPYQDGTTHTEKGLQYIRENSFGPAEGGRGDAQKVVVVLTDGQSTDPRLTFREARKLKLNGTIIVSVGIGQVDATELAGMASGSNYTVQVADFNALDTTLDMTKKLACDAINGIKPVGDLQIPCEERAVDLAILLDTSASEGTTHFREQTSFAADFVSNFVIGPTKLQVGVVTFGNDVYRQFYLNQYDDTNSVVAAIRRIPYSGGSTYTQKALKYMQDVFFQPGYGSRPGVPKVVLIMTDGQSTNRVQTQQEAAALKQAGFLVFGIGIGTTLDMTEVNGIATDSSTAFQVNSFDDLNQFLPTFQTAICDRIDEIMPYVPTPDPAVQDCGQQPADVVFVLDSSSSEGPENFRKQVWFAGNITQKLNVGPGAVQVALLTFSTSTHNVFFLNRYQNKYDVLDAIARTPYYYGATYTDEALKFVRDRTLSTTNGRRLGAQPIIIVLTDGQSSDSMQTLAEAQRLQATGAVVIAIGIGTGVNDRELSAIASDPAHKFNVNSFDFLVSIQQQILKETCEGSGPTPAPHPECGDRPADIVFVMDASSSEGSINFEKMKAFVADFSTQFQVGPSNVQISAVVFSSSIHVEFYLNETTSNTDLLQKITNIRFYGGTTMTHLALQTVRTDVLRPERGARRNAADTVILLTDGRSVLPLDTAKEAQLLKDKGVQVITIGVGSSVDVKELENMASDVQHAFSVINFDALNNIEQELVQTACESCTSTEAADILIIIDSSSNESATLFQQEMNFIDKLVAGFVVGPQNMQFSLMTFATVPNLEFWFNTYDTTAKVQAALQTVMYSKGLTNTHKALQFAREYAYQPFHGSRADKNDYIILVTDGTAANLNETIKEADMLKQQGKTILTVGIGKNADKTELEAVATDASHVFIADNIDALKTIHKDITIRTCNSIFELKATPTPAT